jgi:hypothetical protein
VSVDRQVPDDRDQPCSGGVVLDVQLGAVRPGPQHGFLDKVLGAAAIIIAQHGGQSQQGQPVLGVQAAEGHIRVLRGPSGPTGRHQTTAWQRAAGPSVR